MRQKGYILLLSLLAVLFSAPHATAQIRRGPKTVIRQGQLVKPDTLTRGADSPALQAERFLASADSTLLAHLSGIDSLSNVFFAADSTQLDSIRRTLPPSDSATLAGFDALRHKFAEADSTRRSRQAYNAEQRLQIDSTLIDSLNTLPTSVLTEGAKRKRGWFMSDSMSLSKVCWLSIPLPGYGQIYNKQYWKLPILYGTIGAGLGLFFHENKTYKPLKRQYDALLATGTNRTYELETVQRELIRSNTRRQLYIGAAIASYIYFIGDAAVNYSTNDVSHVKKATTLACICPGAGQIYNKSYWKVPFVVGGFASMIYCIDWNNRGFQRFKKAYTLKSDYDKAPEAHPDGSPDEFNGRYTSNYLKNLKDSYRRNRDLCIIITAGLYILQIVDAHVDAHLKDFDISDDLSMNVEPLFDYTFMPSQGGHRPVFGFNMSFKF